VSRSSRTWALKPGLRQDREGAVALPERKEVMKYSPIIFVASLLLWLAAGSSQAFADTHTVSDSPAIHDHGDPNRPGSLQWTLNRAGSAPATVVLPGDAEYRIGASGVPGALLTSRTTSILSGHTWKCGWLTTLMESGSIRWLRPTPCESRAAGLIPRGRTRAPLRSTASTTSLTYCW
jgi:hypothetical protein